MIAIYYMITNRCVLNCKYCFRDTTEQALKDELDVKTQAEVIEHLYKKWNMRKLTISGGEPLFYGGKYRDQFIEMVRNLKKYKSTNKEDNLRIELLSNGILLNDEVLAEMKGIVDRITITIDSLNDETLTKLGRNTENYKGYLKHFFKTIEKYNEMGFEIKFHSVVTPVNYDDLEQVANEFKKTDLNINKWKLYQYMSYDDPKTDAIYAIDDDRYEQLKNKITDILKDSKISVVFKDNKMMADSMINLLANGKIESYFYDQDGKKHRMLSKIVTNYETPEQLLEENRIEKDRFERHHKL